MNQPLFAIYGASGYGREVMPLVREQLCRQGIIADRLVFVDDNPESSMVNGQRVLSYSQFLTTNASERYAVLAIANSIIREQLAIRCTSDSVRSWAVIPANVLVMDDVQLGEGVILNPFVTLTSNIRIGRHFHANLYSYVAHDCRIGDYVTFAPCVKCNGNVIIEDHVYIGTGAMIKQGKTDRPLVIGKRAVIGMGAVVTKDVPPGETVVGNPAKPLIKG